jgi:FtsH-binding integral membrane protein
MRNTMTERKRRYLKIALELIGGIFLLLYPLMQIWPSGWVWLPRQQEYEQMMIGVYATLGIFLIWASRQPEAHFSLIWFTFWSSLVHGIIMGTQAVIDPAESGHLIGDVAALFVAVVLLGWLTPRERFPKTTDKEDSNIAVKRLNS